MKLYVNGDSHSAAAEAVNSHAFANDDAKLASLGRRPHPDNLKVSYGQLLANQLGAELICDAESASSNDRIIRTTREYLKTQRPDLVIIGWATWEREEWLHDGCWWQISAGSEGHDWPEVVKQQHRQWVMTVDAQRAANASKKIWEFHQELGNIPHVFFNTYSPLTHTEALDWNSSYIFPYDHAYTYYYWLKAQGHQTVNPNSYHYGPTAHQAWCDFLIKFLTATKKESIMFL